MAQGPLAGYPLEDVAVELVDGKSHDTDSSEMAFKIAGTMAMRDAARKAGPCAHGAGDGRRGRYP